MGTTTFAAIDVGSYELEMVIYEITNKEIRQLDHIRHIIALGRDTYNHKAISYELVDELCDVLYDFVNIMNSYDVKIYRAVATSAIREAQNSYNIIDRINVRTGLKVEILANSEQRLIMYEAVATKGENFNKYIDKGAALVDVGAGSTQVSLFDHGSLITTQNVRLGSLRINETLLGALHNNIGSEVMEEYIDADVEVLKTLFFKEKETKCLIAVGDSINWFFSKTQSDLSRDFYSREEFLNIYHSMFLSSDMSNKLSLSREHTQIILSSLMIYKKIMDVTDAEIIWVPKVKICDGLAAEQAMKEKKNSIINHDFNNDIIAAARNISKRYSWNKEHNKFVERNALAIFDALKKLHGLGKRERLLLQIACILHNCGQYISLHRSEECSYDIIMSTEIIGISHVERKMVANVVKYTTIDFNNAKELTRLFTKDQFLTISKLTAIIKIANALDRGHKQKMGAVDVKVDGRELIISTKTYDDISVERAIVDRRNGLMEEVFGLKTVIKNKKVRED